MREEYPLHSRRLHEEGFPAPFLRPWMEAGVGDLACWRGEPEVAGRALRVAVIGTRNAGPASLVAVEALSTRLADEGAPVVSGAAAGTDLAAHRAALEAGGSTVACLPFGLGFVANPDFGGRAFLADEPGRALLLSPFAHGQRPTRQTPVVRNRLIAAFSHAVVVGEAQPESGTYHCAAFALRIGRPVFVLRAEEPAPAELRRLQRQVTARNGGRVYTAEECYGEALAREVLAAAGRFARKERRREAAQPDLLEGGRT